MRRPSICFIALLLASLAVQTSWAIGNPPHLTGPDVLQFLATATAKGDTTFASHNMGAADSDAEITFSKNNAARYTVFGIAVFTYTGTYSVDDSGTINIVALMDKREKHLSVHLYKDQKGYFLLPAEQNPQADPKGGKGTTEFSIMMPCPPFRQVR